MKSGRDLKVIIDTDPGADDAIAILMALAWRGLDLVGVTTVGGNVPLARGTRNALALLQYAGRQDVPVARGAARPCRGSFGYSYTFHGRSGLTRRLPQPRTRPVEAGATEFLAGTLEQNTGQVTLVALGPLTNLAHLLKQYPTALRQVASLIVMGGAVDREGNVTPYAEFNFHSDPVAAHSVLSSGIPLTLVDLGAGGQASIARESMEGLRSGSKLGQLTLQLLNNWFRQDPRRERFEFYDPLAFAVAMHPDIVTTRQTKITVENVDQCRMGESRTVARDGPVAVADRVNAERFFGLLEDLFDWRRR